MNHAPVNDNAVKDSAANLVPVNHAAANDSTLSHSPANDNAVNRRSVNDGAVNHGPGNYGALSHGPADDSAVNHGPGNYGAADYGSGNQSAADYGPGNQSTVDYEAGVAQIFREVLGRDDTDVSERYFAAGGDPLLAARIVSLVRQRWGVHIPVADFLEAGTVAVLADAVTTAMAAQAERTAASARSATRAATVPRRPADAAPLLSFGQERIWLESHLLPGAAYNVHGRRRLIGELDLGVLEASVRAVIARHETLRSRFPVVDGLPVQVVDEPDPSWRLAVTDVGTADDPAEAARRLADAEAAEPFDLARDRLLRCSVIRVGDGEHLLAVTVHHIVADAWSIRLFVQEVAALYSAGADVRRAGLPELPVQYRDFAVWQRERLAGEALRESVEHWRRHLDGAPPALLLPATRRRSATQQIDGRRVQDAFSREETAALRETCWEHEVTVFMALLAGLADVLGRWSGQQDVVIGVPVAGRTAAGTGGLIGFFVNTLPIRMAAGSGGSGLGEALGRARRATLDGFAHAEAPFDVLVRELQPPQDPRRAPLFQIVLNLIESPVEERIGGLRVEPAQAPALPPIADLVITAQDVGGSLQLQVDFDAERCSEELVRELTRQWHGLVVGTQDPVSGSVASSSAASRMAGADVAEVPELSVGDDIDGFVDWLRSSAVEEVYLTAPMLRAIGRRQQPELPALRRVFVDNRGDLLAHDVEVLRRLWPGRQCVGVYRAGADRRPVATFAVPDGWRDRTAPLRVPLGTAVSGVEVPVEVRRSSGELAANCEVGEIWRGRERTGDLGRWLPDGTLEFVARRGESLVLDSTETCAALRDLPEVSDAVIVRHAAADGTVVHAAYVVGGGSAAALRQHLVPLLPEYLIPDKFFVLDELPLTSEGTYDLLALPVPDLDDDEDTYVAPRTPMEDRLTRLVRELLELDRVGVQDSFFDLGGFSLLATRLAAAVQTEFGVELPLRDMYTAPTVEGLAQLILRVQGELAGDDDLEALLAQIEAG